MGYSSSWPVAVPRVIANSLPSGDESAIKTPSAISRGAPPEAGTRASVPGVSPHRKTGPRINVISPFLEIDMGNAFLMPSGRDSGLLSCVEYSSSGLPSQAAA